LKTPIYIQIKKKIQEEIKDKNSNDAIESERDLSKRLDASRMTVRKAIDELVEEGFLYRKKNKGTFVSDKSLWKKNTSVTNSEDEKLEYRLINFDVKYSIKDDVLSPLKLNDNDSFSIIRAIRVVLKDKKPQNVEEFYIVRNFIDERNINKFNKSYLYLKLKLVGFLGDRGDETTQDINDEVRENEAQTSKDSESQNVKQSAAGRNQIKREISRNSNSDVSNLANITIKDDQRLSSILGSSNIDLEDNTLIISVEFKFHAKQVDKAESKKKIIKNLNDMGFDIKEVKVVVKEGGRRDSETTREPDQKHKSSKAKDSLQGSTVSKSNSQKSAGKKEEDKSESSNKNSEDNSSLVESIL